MIFVGRLEPLLAAVLTEDTGRFDAALEATVQLLERLTLAGVHKHAGSLAARAKLAAALP
jgi:hypothetical protein